MISSSTSDFPHILLVDDEASNRAVFGELLRGREHHVLTAADTDEARDVIRREKVDIVVCDQEMPGEDGLTFLTALRESHPLIPRILMTGHLSAANALRGVNEARLLRYIQKPCSAQDLLDAVSEAWKTLKIEKEHLLAMSRKDSWARNFLSERTVLTQIVFTGVLALTALTLSAAVLFLLLYLFKSLLGIDLCPELHLKDVL